MPFTSYTELTFKIILKHKYCTRETLLNGQKAEKTISVKSTKKLPDLSIEQPFVVISSYRPFIKT